MRFIFSTVCTFFLIYRLFAGTIPFPSSPDWKPLRTVVTYSGENLWEHNDGAADQFIRYGMIHCAVGEFKTGDISFTVEVYDMGEILNAFGIYQLKSRGNRERLKIGAASSVALPAQCMLFQDKYYVLIQVFAGGLSEALAESLLTTCAESLPGKTQLPAEIRLLPKKNQIPGSIGFSKSSYLGLSDLNNCLFASYLDSTGEEYQSFVIFPAAADTSVQSGTITGTGAAWLSQNSDGFSFKYRRMSDHGYVGIIEPAGTDYRYGVTAAGGADDLAKRLSSLSMRSSKTEF